MAALLLACREMMEFSTSDPVRYQLLFQRTLPGFVPSDESYAVAQQFYDWHRARLEAVGIRGQGMVDVFVALQAGLQEAQLANDPGGDRWAKHLDWVIEMFVARALAQPPKHSGHPARHRPPAAGKPNRPPARKHLT